jgi:chemotaxis protein methyltransferase CheR
VPPFSPNENVIMKPEEFRLLRDLIAQKTGISYSQDARAMLERRLRERLLALSLPSFAEYFQYLRFNPRAQAEWDDAIEVLTTNETYLFREDYQLRAFKNEVLPMLAAQARPRKSLSIWSAGCSTGEEVYTIAILVFESRIFDGWDVRIFGSDISRRCVATARAGVYGHASFRTTPAEAKRTYFAERNGMMHVHERIREMCQFGQLNLLDDQRARLLGKFDAIFCRNVLIYFDAHARRRVIDVFHERLYPGGVLFLGHSESLLNVSTAFELLHLKEDLVYRKPPRTEAP